MHTGLGSMQVLLHVDPQVRHCMLPGHFGGGGMGGGDGDGVGSGGGGGDGGDGGGGGGGGWLHVTRV